MGFAEVRVQSRFQSFAAQGGPEHGAERLGALRRELQRRQLTGFLIPRSDEHQNEYVPPSSERLLWLTGFSGSAGLAIVLRDKAALFVDGRYTVQAPQQIDSTVVEALNLADISPSQWLESHLSAGDRLGYDPWLHTQESIDKFIKSCALVGAELVEVDSNPVDAIWSDRPSPPLGQVSLYPSQLAGESAEDKIKAVKARLQRVDGLLVSDAHNVAWAFNIRGSDVSHTPLPLSFAFIPRDGRPTIFIDARKLSNSVRDRLSSLADIEEPERLLGFVEALGKRKATVLFDASTGPAKLAQSLLRTKGDAHIGQDPISLLKAKKNGAELAGIREAHVRDGAAMVRFLAWFDDEAPKGRLTEISAALALEAFRAETGELRELSFPSIAAAGPHAAIPHYRVSEASNLSIGKGFFLIDSGAQYQDGTTDITRTIPVGTPSKEMRDRFTRVLKGHIAIARAVFPVGVSGAQIDAFARQALWQAGLDFDHGTGHGVGAFLSVHEGPQRIAKTGTVALEPGMILSNEPGYYAAGRFGIRLENLVVVESRDIPGAERKMLGFETISLAPIDLRAVEPKMLTPEETAWLDRYHAWVRKTLSPRVDAATRAWLKQATRKVSPA